MRMKSRVDKYLKHPESKRQNMALEWCLRFLNVNLDRMTHRDFTELVTEYESIVMYPYSPHVRWRFQNEDEAKTAFKEYQTIAQLLIDEIKGLSPGTLLHVNIRRSVVISSAPDGKINIDTDDDQNFEYSFAHHISRLLYGRKFDEAVKSCPYCGHYFPIVTGHKKRYCSRGCATKYGQKKRWEENPERAKRIRKLQTQFSRLNKKYPNEARRRKEMMKYIKKNAYEWSEISEKIKLLLN